MKGLATLPIFFYKCFVLLYMVTGLAVFPPMCFSALVRLEILKF